MVSSPLARTRQTADTVAAALGLEVEIDDDVAECAFGEWEGLTFAEVEQTWPDALAAWLASTAVAPPGGESFDEVTRRVKRSRDRMLVTFTGRTVLVVSHVTPIKTLVRLALDAPGSALYRMELSPASLTTVAWFTDGNASLRSFNDVAHLEGSLPPTWNASFDLCRTIVPVNGSARGRSSSRGAAAVRRWLPRARSRPR